MRGNEDLRRSWEDWLGEPPRRSGRAAVQEARRRASRLGRRRTIAGGAALTAALLIAGLWVQRTGTDSDADKAAHQAEGITEAIGVHAVGGDVVVLPLDERTRLYLVLPRNNELEEGGST